MEVIRPTTAEKYEPEENWIRTLLCDQKDVSIEHFVKPPLHSSPKHSHDNAQVLYVLKGMITIKTEDDEQKLNSGDCVYIPGNEIHIVTNPQNEIAIGLDIFIAGRSFDFWLTQNKP